MWNNWPVSVDSESAASPDMERMGHRGLPQRSTDMDLITDRDNRDRRRPGMPERTIGALTNNVAWLAGETAVVMLVVIFTHRVIEGVAKPIIIGLIITIVRIGEELRQQLWLARHAVVVDGVIEHLGRNKFANDGRNHVKVRYTTERGSAHFCWMYVPPSTVGDQVSVRHDPWFSWRASYGLSGGHLVARIVVQRIANFFIFGRRITYHFITGLLCLGVISILYLLL